MSAENLLTFRSAKVADLLVVPKGFDAEHAECIATLEPTPQTIEDLTSWIEARQPLIVAERAGQVLGWAHACASSDPGVGEHHVYVNATGQAQELGRQLLLQLCGECARRGMHKLTNRIFADNDAGRAVHHAAEFEEVGIQRRHVKLNGEWKDCVLVDRLLGDAAETPMSASARARGGTGANSAFRTPSQGHAYLEQALEALRDSSSADVLYRELDPFHKGQFIFGPAQERMDALNRRLRYLRSAVLFAALSVEAYANEFLAATLPATDVKSIDQLKPIEKLVIGPKVAGFDTPFRHGLEPLQSIVRLFKARNRLVHARPGETGAYVHVTTEEDVATFGPRAAVRYIEAAAHVSVLLHPLRPDNRLEAPASRVWEQRAVLHHHVELTGAKLTDLPQPGAEPLPLLMNQMHERAIKHAGREQRST